MVLSVLSFWSFRFRSGVPFVRGIPSGFLSGFLLVFLWSFWSLHFSWSFQSFWSPFGPFRVLLVSVLVAFSHSENETRTFSFTFKSFKRLKISSTILIVLYFSQVILWSYVRILWAAKPFSLNPSELLQEIHFCAHFFPLLSKAVGK